MLRATIITLFTLASSALALVHGVDSSTLVSKATYAKAKSEGFTKAVIRGYYEACAAGGSVDPNFVTSYNNARAAGITNIDTYWFPCTGASNSCKSYAKQLAELGATFKAHKMNIGRIWIDFEKDSVCNNWNYGTSRNLAEAKKIIAAAKASGYKFGIYSSPGEWSSLFGSYSAVVDSSAPLWLATYNNVQTLTLGTKFGGWTKATGHQYTDQSASGKFDLNVFAS